MPESLSIAYGYATHVGLLRTDNQDACGKFPQDGEDGVTQSDEILFVVADGMGGHQAGQVASTSAVQVIPRWFFSANGDPGRRLRQALEHANAEVFGRAQQDATLRGMGTTCTAMALRDDGAWLAHVGDSRAYRLSHAGMEQITTDHTRVQELVRMHVITPEEAAVHPHRHMLQRSLGPMPEIEVDVAGPLPLRDDDRFLLCTDGLTGISDDVLLRTILELDPQDASDRLVELANEEGGRDNVTVMVIHIRRAGASAPARRLWRLFGV